MALLRHDTVGHECDGSLPHANWRSMPGRWSEQVRQGVAGRSRPRVRVGPSAMATLCPTATKAAVAPGNATRYQLTGRSSGPTRWPAAWASARRRARAATCARAGRAEACLQWASAPRNGSCRSEAPPGEGSSAIWASAVPAAHRPPRPRRVHLAHEPASDASKAGGLPDSGRDRRSGLAVSPEVDRDAGGLPCAAARPPGPRRTR